MRVINSGTGEDWEYVLGVWKNDFNDPDNFRSALTKACGDDIGFHDLMSRVAENLDAYDLIEKASLVDLGRLTDRTVARVAAWDEGFRSERGDGSLAGHYRLQPRSDWERCDQPDQRRRPLPVPDPKRRPRRKCHCNGTRRSRFRRSSLFHRSVSTWTQDTTSSRRSPTKRQTPAL